eukprot:3939034-Rhodomonas_salina.1
MEQRDALLEFVAGGAGGAGGCDARALASMCDAMRAWGAGVPVGCVVAVSALLQGGQLGLVGGGGEFYCSVDVRGLFPSGEFGALQREFWEAGGRGAGETERFVRRVCGRRVAGAAVQALARSAGGAPSSVISELCDLRGRGHVRCGTVLGCFLSGMPRTACADVRCFRLRGPVGAAACERGGVERGGVERGGVERGGVERGGVEHTATERKRTAAERESAVRCVGGGGFGYELRGLGEELSRDLDAIIAVLEASDSTVRCWAVAAGPHPLAAGGRYGALVDDYVYAPGAAS